MIVYVSSLDQNKDKIIKDVLEKGHTVTCMHQVYSEPAKHLIAISDILVYEKAGQTLPLHREERTYAESLGMAVFEYPEIPDLHPTEVRNPNQALTFREIQGKMFRMHLRKNADYSPANILGTGEIGLVTRMWDKMARLLNLTGFNLTISASTFGVPKQPKNESIEDTIMDLAVYSIISLIFRRGKWGN